MTDSNDLTEFEKSLTNDDELLRAETLQAAYVVLKAAERDRIAKPNVFVVTDEQLRAMLRCHRGVGDPLGLTERYTYTLFDIPIIARRKK